MKSKEEVKAQRAAYYAAHKEESAAQGAAWRAANHEKSRAQQAEYYAANAEKRKGESLAYYTANKEKIKARKAAYQKANAEAISARRKARYAAEAEVRKARTAAWRQANLERAKERDQCIGARRIARIRKVSVNDFTIAEWRELKQEYGQRCAYCGAEEPLEVEHMIPLSRGGNNTKSNVVPSCRSCNQHKARRTPEEWKR